MDSSGMSPIVVDIDDRYSEQLSEILYALFLFLCFIISAMNTIRLRKRLRIQPLDLNTGAQSLNTGALYLNMGSVIAFDWAENVIVENNIKKKNTKVRIPRYINGCRVYVNNGSVVVGGRIDGYLKIRTNAE